MSSNVKMNIICKTLLKIKNLSYNIFMITNVRKSTTHSIHIQCCYCPCYTAVMHWMLREGLKLQSSGQLKIYPITTLQSLPKWFKQERRRKSTVDLRSFQPPKHLGGLPFQEVPLWLNEQPDMSPLILA